MQVYKEAFKARATSLRARRVASAFNVASALNATCIIRYFLLYLHYNLKIITKKVN
jgi:hypothetical protein